MALTRKRLVFLTRLLVIISISYLTLLAPAREQAETWVYGLILLYLVSNLGLSALPDRYFTRPGFFYGIVLIDCLFIVWGIYLTGMGGTDLYLVFFLIVCMATLGANLRNLMIASFLFVLVYGWLLHQQGLLQGDMAINYSLRLPFILVVALFLGYIVDIQTRDQERRLKASEERLRLAGRASYDLIYEHRVEDGSLQWFLGDVGENLGYSSQTVAQNVEQWRALIHPEDIAVFDKALTWQKKRTEPLSSEYRVRHRDGSWRFWSDHSLPLINDKGLPWKWIGVCKDITRCKELEKQLQESRKMEAVEVLAGGVAHNLNNMLMGIQGNISIMLLDKPSSEPDYQNLKSIQTYIKQATHLTRDLLGFARGGACNAVPVSCNEMVAAANRCFAMIREDIVFQELFSPDDPVIEIDRMQMRQVMMNLYLNAAEAMPEGGRLSVRTGMITLAREEAASYALAPGRYVMVAVADTGSGMEPEVIRKIFDPFFTTKKPGVGKGMGLSSVYGIIRNHGGHIRVDSARGQGTTVVFYLPVSDKTPAVEEKPSPGRQTAAGTGTILVVDNEEMVVKTCQRLLQHLDYHVITARSGKEAVDIYREKRDLIDLVLVDAMMPGINGSDIYDTFKAIDPEIRVMLSCACSPDHQTRQMLSRGCRGIIQKPYDLQEMSRKLREVLEEQ